MVIDTSALIAILEEEPECDRFIDRIEKAVSRLMSAASLVEVSMLALARYGEEGLEGLRRLIRVLDIDVVPVTHDQTDFAVEAFRLYGKGRHPAKLNFGDCFACGLAKATGEPLLYKGDDFAKTDLA